MTIDRRQFLVASGAFAAAGALTASGLAADVTSPTNTIDLGSQGALYRVLLNAGDGRGFFCIAAVLPRRSFAARIVQQQTRTVTAVEDVGRNTRATVAINGGRFNGAFAPDGLLIADGKTVGQKRADWMGYLVIDEDGNATVTSKPELHKARYAVQGNPLLIEPGGKIGIAREDNRIFRRTIIAQSGDVIVAMVVTTPVSLFNLAYALIERPDVFYLNRIDAALNLSGAATTSFYAKAANGEQVTVPAFWPNRDVITFTPRNA